jgi:hypothetical protein
VINDPQTFRQNIEAFIEDVFLECQSSMAWQSPEAQQKLREWEEEQRAKLDALLEAKD